MRVLVLFISTLFFFNFSQAQNRSPIDGFPGALEAAMQIVDKNPKIYTQLSTVNPNDIAMCAAAGMFAASEMVINARNYNDNMIKVQAFNAGLMAKAFSRLNSLGTLPDGSLKPYTNLFKQEGVLAFNKIWPVCDKIIAGVLPLIQSDFSIYISRPFKTSLNTQPNTPVKAPFKVSFVYVGQVGDGGWTFSHEIGRRQIEKVFGEKVVTTFVENVPENADAERVIRDIVAQGSSIIFGTTFGYMEPMLKVAAANKGVKFEHATGYKTTENMRTYESRTYESAYLAGVIAGKMTKTNVLGFVAPIPIPEVIRNINSYTMGAQSVNPKIKTKVVWVNEWFNPVKESEAAASLINSGADVLMQNTDSSAVLQTAEKLGKRAFGWDSDMTAYAPKAHLGSAVINWGPYYVKTVRDALEGKWTGNQTAWWGLKEGAVDLVSVAADVPEEAKKKLNEVKFGLKNGSLVIWKGPIVGQDGKFVLSRNAVADDKFLSGINFYVQGVDGKIPGGK